MSRQYVQHGIRETAEHFCTRQLGYRTQLDATEAKRRDITENRFTSIDRQLIKDASELSLTGGRQYFAVVRNGSEFAASEAARLAVLQRMGLAEGTGAGTWLVRRDFEQILRAMQRTSDRQKTLAAHGALLSDERLPIEALDFSRKAVVEGRILVHGQDEQSGRNYLMLESTEAKVYFIQYTPEMEEARNRGDLRVNSFVRMRNFSARESVVLNIQDLGNAEQLLSKSQYFIQAAKKHLKQGIMPTENGWGGWLGQYQANLAQAVQHMAEVGRQAPEMKQRNPQRDRSFGR
jgi:hypothetical protein